jgi:STE24 endopeptidase
MDADWIYSAYHYSHPILTERLRAIGWERQAGGAAAGDQSKDADLREYSKADRASGREL